MTNDPDLQRQARALGDPTRYAIYRHIASADDPVGVAELTDLVGLNHNAVRQHLGKLVEAGLLTQATESRTTRGRPRLVFTLDPASADQWGADGSYHRLSMLLLEMVSTGDSAEDVGRRSGREASVASHEGADPVAALGDAIARSGFEPTLRDVRGRTEFVLHRCTFADAAAVDPDTVCRIHLGIARGIADQLGTIEVDDLVAADPYRAGCRLVFHTTGPDDQ